MERMANQRNLKETALNPVLMLMYNTTRKQLDLSKAALDSVLGQDIGNLFVRIVNNGSNEDTGRWLSSLPLSGSGFTVSITTNKENESPLKVANREAAKLFQSFEYILGVPNDVVLPENLYRELLKFDEGFVSAGMGCPDNPPPRQEAHFLHTDCHFAVSITRKWAYEKIVNEFGSFFDEDYFHYASDVDMKQRWKKVGLVGAQTDIQCWHFGSASWRLATDEAKKEILEQADRDRETYYRKWGERL